MKLLILTALLGVSLAQFGGSRCDIRALAEAGRRKETCFEDVKTMFKDAVRAIQRYDSTCNTGMVETCEKCSPLVKQLKQGNDLDVGGVVDCCFPGRTGNSASRRCEWKNKEKNFMKGGKGKGGKGKGKGRGRGGPMGEMDMEEMMMQMMTVGGMSMMGLSEMGEKMCEKLTWCENEDRPANQMALQQAVRPWKDRIIAKTIECFTPFMQVATNCTDIQGEDIKCLMNGMGWSECAEEACYMMCSPDSLDVFCNAYTTAANSGQTSGSGGAGNFFDPFNFNSGSGR